MSNKRSEKLDSQKILSYQTRRIMEYIDKKLPKEVTLAQTAEDLQLSKSYICRLFKQEANICFVDYVNKQRIYIGKSLLRETDLSVLEIALEAGFTNQHYFARVFRKYNNISPLQYRTATGHQTLINK